jgi:hypothetical protein
MISRQSKSHDSAFLELIGQLSQLVSVAVGNPPDFAVKWDAVVSAFMAWLKGLPAAVSPISRNLELLRRIEQEFDTSSLKGNDPIVKLLLSGTAKQGEQVTIRGQSWLVVNRAVSANYGVEYTLINAKGEQLRQEFFD